MTTRRQALRIFAAAGAALAVGGGVAELIRTGRLHRVRRSGTRMGTRVSLTAVHPDPGAAREWLSAAFEEMERLEAILSRHRSATPVARLNREGRLEDAPPELIHVLEKGLELSARTGGAFDMTVGPLLALHQESFARTGMPPGVGEVAEALSRVGWRALRVQGRSVSFETPGMAVTLDGIAKGHIVDRTVALLKAEGAERVLVDAGGDMASAGTPAPGDPWRIGIQSPEHRLETLATLALRGEAVATSGSYVQSFTADGAHHHILDPRTGWSPPGTLSVTVITPTALEADALSTAAFVLGPREGHALLDAGDGVEGLIVTRKGEELATRGFRRHLG